MMSFKGILNLFRRQDVGAKEAAEPNSPGHEKSPAETLRGERNLLKRTVPFLKTAERFLILFSIGLLAFNLAQVLFFPDPRMSRWREEQEILNEEDQKTMIAWGETQSFNSYADVINKRDIFKGLSLNAETQPVFNQEEPGQAVTMDLSTNYRLAGIVLDQKPQAVIEDITKQETLFVSVGDRLAEGVVEEILRDRVVVRINSQRLELLR